MWVLQLYYQLKKKMLEKLRYRNLINNFAFQKARKINFK